MGYGDADGEGLAPALRLEVGDADSTDELAVGDGVAAGDPLAVALAVGDPLAVSVGVALGLSDAAAAGREGAWAMGVW
jgi:hypothetical protein